MFYYIEGKLAHLDYGFAVVDANGVGYKLTITQTTYESMPAHLSVIEFWIQKSCRRQCGSFLISYYTSVSTCAYTRSAAATTSSTSA